MKYVVNILLLAALLLSSCSAAVTPAPATATTPATPAPTATTKPFSKADCYSKDMTIPIDDRVELLLGCMTLDEKIGQMTQVQKWRLQPGDVSKYLLGSVLSGGGGYPAEGNTPENWAKMIDGFQAEALSTRLGIPIIYGVDAVHGHNNLLGATIFPQQIALGAANDPALVEKIGRATAEEMLATGATWDFAPVVAVPQDIRWGRTYEGYSEDTSIVSSLGVAFIRGLQTQPEGFKKDAGDSIYVLATPKHFLGDGGTSYGTSTQNIMNKKYLLDQGDMQVDEATIRARYLPPYKAAVDAGAMSIMVSFSSWNGVKMHGQKTLLTDILKGELGFKGFLISDWGGIDQIAPGDYYKSVVTAINAGVDMNMVPDEYGKFIDTMKEAVAKGDIKQERVDDAVRRILRAKFMLGLFYHPNSDPALLSTIRSQAHLDLAREAVRKSLVLLKNEQNALPLLKDAPVLLVAGEAADDTGIQSGGWTLEWLGKPGKTIVGTTILDAIKSSVSKDTRVLFSRFGRLKEKAEVGIVVIGEQPYAEGVGDSADLAVSAADINVIKAMRPLVKKLVVVQLSGRPLIISDLLPMADAWVAAWLPGSEGQGVTDVLFGDYPFTGKLPYTWPRSIDQLPININNSQGKTGCDAPLFPFGYGLAIGETAPALEDCK